MDELIERITDMHLVLMDRSYTFPDYESDEKHLKELEDLINEMESVFSKDDNYVQEVFGGELKNSTYRSHGMQLPLFMYIDFMIIAIEENMVTTTDLNDQKSALIERLKKVREKAAKLPHKEIFDPNKEISKKTRESIGGSRGSFSFGVEEIDGDDYLHFMAVVGIDYFDRSYFKTETKNERGLAYEDDIKHLEMVRTEKNKKKIEEMISHISHYFKDNKIPTDPDKFHEELVDVFMNDTLSYGLYRLVEAILEKAPVEEIDKLFDSVLITEANLKAKEVETKKEEKVQEVEIEEEKVEEPELEKKEEPIPSKKGMFGRLKGFLSSSPAEEQTKEEKEESIERFENERKKQIIEDEEIRNVVIYKMEMIDGKQVLVPLDNSEYKVVKR